MRCSKCKTEIPTEEASEPCPACGSFDRDVTDSEEGHAEEDWSLRIAVEVLENAEPADVADALTRIAEQLGVTVAFTYGTSGLTVTRDGVTNHYAFADIARGQGIGLDPKIVATVAAQVQEALPMPVGTAFTIDLDRALQMILSSTKLGGVLATLSGNPAGAAALFMVATVIEAIVAGIAATKQDDE